MTPEQARGIIGIEIGYTESDLKKAYRKRAMDVHPDREGGSDEAFRELTDAFKLLSDILSNGYTSESTFDTIRDVYEDVRSTYAHENWGSGVKSAQDILHVIRSGQNPAIDIMMEQVMNDVIEELMSEDDDDEDQSFVDPTFL